MSHHYSGPDFGFPRGDAQLDLTDLYAFPKPGDASKSIFILNVHPSSTVIQPRSTTVQPFAAKALYEIRIDTNGDAMADVTYQVAVAASEGDAQTVTLRRLDRAQSAARSVCGCACWSQAPAGGWVQVERGARPQHAVFLAGDARDAYHAAEPAGDSQFVPVFAHALEHAGRYAPGDARRAAEKLLPEILLYDPALPAEYPHNGRALSDPVTAVFLPILTNGKVRDDGVGPHGDLRAEFPYLDPPHHAKDGEVK